MKWFYFLILVSEISIAQSPFDYGQNENVYFISVQQRIRSGINDIYIIEQDEKASELKQQWDVNRISFHKSGITNNWYPVSRDKKYRFSFEDLIRDLRFYNGERFDFENRSLASYGGQGYGSFDFRDIYRFGDSISIISTSCTGHCGSRPITYSKHRFNKQWRILYSVFYPTPLHGRDELLDEPASPVNYEKYFGQLIKDAEVPADTIYYSYDERGRLLNFDREHKPAENPELHKLFSFADRQPLPAFHQCYIGKIKMESYFRDMLGYTPKFVLIEIYRYGVFSFIMDTRDRKYYPGKTLMMER